jgi:hypothetical protein
VARVKLSERTLTDLDALLARLAEVRARGYAVSDGENAYGLVTVAAPVLDPRGAPSAGVSLTVGGGRMSGAEFAVLAAPHARRLAASWARGCVFRWAPSGYPGGGRGDPARRARAPPARRRPHRGARHGRRVDGAVRAGAGPVGRRGNCGPAARKRRAGFRHAGGRARRGFRSGGGPGPGAGRRGDRLQEGGQPAARPCRRGTRRLPPPGGLAALRRCARLPGPGPYHPRRARPGAAARRRMVPGRGWRPPGRVRGRGAAGAAGISRRPVAARRCRVRRGDRGRPRARRRLGPASGSAGAVVRQRRARPRARRRSEGATRDRAPAPGARAVRLRPGGDGAAARGLRPVLDPARRGRPPRRRCASRGKWRPPGWRWRASTFRPG